MDKEEEHWNKEEERFEDYEGGYIYCPDCGGEMEWCYSCKVYTQTCCIEYGTCLCS